MLNLRIIYFRRLVFQMDDNYTTLELLFQRGTLIPLYKSQRREGVNDGFTALGWKPEGRRARGRPRTTWRRTVEEERNKAGWASWEVDKAVARNRECWSESVTALCAYWREET
ncbi:hypothetical protein ACROYT_G022258 [Oculina patagonica]